MITLGYGYENQNGLLKKLSRINTARMVIKNTGGGSYKVITSYPKE